MPTAAHRPARLVALTAAAALALVPLLGAGLDGER